MIIVERAHALLDRAAVEAKLRNAPDWVRRGESRLVRPTPPLPASPKKFSGVLCGVAAPGLSVPCRCALDSREIPETIDADAWPEALAAITKEKPIWLDSRHYGGHLATTADGTLRLSCHRLLGLMIEADMPDEPLARVLITNAGLRGVGLSIGFSTSKIEHRTVAGQTIRVIRKIKLDHVALIASGQQPAYRGAIGYFAPHGNRRAIDDASRDARVDAWRHVKAYRETGLAIG